MNRLFSSGGQSIGASASTSVFPVNIQGLFPLGLTDLLAVQGILRSLLQYYNLKASILWLSAFFTLQLSHLYMTTGKILTLIKWTFIGKVMSLLFNMFSTAAAESLQLCLTLCNPIDSSPPGSPIPGILQARTLEWVAISFPNA